MESKQKTIKLKSAENDTFQVELSIAKEMQTVYSFLSDADADVGDAVIPLPNVMSREMSRTIEYIRWCRSGNSKEFDALKDKLRAVDVEELKELLLAANYLNVKDLLEFSCTTMADRIKNKSVEYVRKVFGIVSDFTPEEEAKLREENSWAFQGVDSD